jgi:hypothetical protein
MAAFLEYTTPAGNVVHSAEPMTTDDLEAHDICMADRESLLDGEYFDEDEDPDADGYGWERAALRGI